MTQKHLATGLVLLLLCGLVMAQESAPRSAPAQRAMQRHAQAAKRAEQEYQRAMADATKALIRELEEAKAQAMKASQLEEANAIQSAIDTAKADLDELQGKVQAREFSIDAAKEWQPTIDVRKGQRVQVKATGRWSGATDHGPRGTCGPDGTRHPQQGHLTYYLEGKVGDGSPFKIGSHADFIAEADGQLLMQMNDTNRPNNAGRLTVRIAIAD